MKGEFFLLSPLNASLIDELSQVVVFVSKNEHICKHKGLSKKTVSESRKEIEKHLFSGNARMIHLGECLTQFLIKEAMLLGEDITAHNISSDVLESLFGIYKARKSPNKLNSINPFILFAPLYTKLRDSSKNKKFDFINALEEKRMSHIKAWVKENLSPNLVQLRIKRLGKAG